MLADLAAPYVLLDDARPVVSSARNAGGVPARLYHAPVDVLATADAGAIPDLIEQLRRGVAGGLHAAGFLAYEAAPAFEPALQPVSGALPVSSGPLMWFGLFERYREIAPAELPGLLPDPAGALVGLPQPQISRAQYDALVARLLDHIRAGDLYQANLTFAAHVPVAGHPLAAYARMRAAAAAGWGAVVNTGDAIHLSLSPELFFALEGGVIRCRPMKGTARRGDTRAEDQAAADGLAADAKQRAENLMIVDLMRNDLSRVATPGSVTVPALFSVETYPTVHQMVSDVTATLAPGRDAVDVLAALFPCGSITGAPKISAMRAITAIEPAPRGLYTGAIGRIDAGGVDAMFNVAIRTLTLEAGTGHARFGIGSGIVADSTAAAEWDECLAKAAFLTSGQRDVDLIETMAFDPVAGLPLLDRHLARMKASAQALGFTFDRHAARNDLQAATFRLRAPVMVRLMLSRSGITAIETRPMPVAADGLVRVGIAALPVHPADFRLRHKTSDRAFYDEARRSSGADEVLFVRDDGLLTEGSFTSLFVPRGDVLLTPPQSLGLLPGVLRSELISTGRAVEGDLRVEDLSGGFFIGNAVRGLVPAVLMG